MADSKRREVRARDRFVAWRRTRKPKSRIPEPLWSLAVKLVATHGLHRVAATLKLDYYSLKKRVEAAAGSRWAIARCWVVWYDWATAMRLLAGGR